MNNSAGNSVIQSARHAEQRAVPTDKQPVINQITNNIIPVNGKNGYSFVDPPANNQVRSSKIALQPAIAANTTVIAGDGNIINQKTGNLFVTGTDSEQKESFLKNVEKINPQFSTSGSKYPPDNSTANLISSNIITYKTITPDEGAEDRRAPSSQKRIGRWSLKTEFASFLNNLPHNSDQINYLNSSGYQNNENQNVTSENSCSAEIIAGYKVSRRITIKSGLGYNNIRQTIQNSGKGYLKRCFQYIEVPLRVACKLFDGKIGIGFTGGLSSGFLIGNNEVLSVNNEQPIRGKTANMQSITYSGLVGLEFGYDITKHLTITLEPRLRHDLNSLSANNSVNYKADHLGIVTGLAYCFD